MENEKLQTPQLKPWNSNHNVSSLVDEVRRSGPMECSWIAELRPFARQTALYIDIDYYSSDSVGNSRTAPSPSPA